MHTDRTITSHGYDHFIGRICYEDGSERIASLNLQSGGYDSFTDLERACFDLQHHVSEGRRVLFTKSPGTVDAGIVTEEEMHDFLTKLGLKPGPSDGVKSVDFPAGEFLPFKPEQLKALRGLYKEIGHMAKYDNPFVNQPK